MTSPTIKVYDNQFNMNEWTVVLALCLGLLVVFVLPRRFSAKLSIMFFMIGVTFGFIFDHLLSVMPVSYYDMNDTSEVNIMDWVAMWMYGPLSYVFYYLYDFLKVSMKFAPIYVLCATLISTCFEWCTVQLGIFHYDHGYGLRISFVIYLIVHTTWVCFFYLLRRADANRSNLT